MIRQFCIDCGAAFPENVGRARMRCDVCQRKHRRVLDRERYEQRRRALNEKTEPPKPKKLTLSEAASRASALHMSYGEFVARFGL